MKRIDCSGKIGLIYVKVTLETDDHVTPRIQQASAKRFDEAFTNGYNDSRVSEIFERVAFRAGFIS